MLQVGCGHPLKWLCPLDVVLVGVLLHPTTSLLLWNGFVNQKSIHLNVVNQADNRTI